MMIYGEILLLSQIAIFQRRNGISIYSAYRAAHFSLSWKIFECLKSLLVSNL